MAGQMLKHRLITKQTPPDGVLVNHVMVAESVNIDKEAYFAIVMDRKAGGPVMIASSKGGVDIEQVAAETPQLVLTEPIDIKTGVRQEQVAKLAQGLGFSAKNVPTVCCCSFALLVCACVCVCVSRCESCRC